MKKYLQSVTLLLAALMMPAAVSAASTEVVRGDVNSDTFVNISDAIALINYLSSGDASGIDMANADCTQEGEVNISDAISLINFLSTNEWPDSPEPDQDYVDLGLPSGTLWATRNVGANGPEEAGDYFAWGETEPNKEIYKWSTYAWANVVNNKTTLTKYCTKSDNGYNGFTDGKTELDPEDDAACAHYPNGRMPSKDQLEELIAKCTWEWTQQNGVNGMLVTGPNGNTMFLPTTGYRFDNKLNNADVEGHYWMRTMNFLSPTYTVPLNGTKLFFNSTLHNSNSSSRCNGYAVRAVRATEE